MLNSTVKEDDDMADDKIFSDRYSSDSDNDVISDIEALTRKYGLADEVELPKRSYAADPTPAPYNPSSPAADFSVSPIKPKNNAPARTPRIVYNTGGQTPGISLAYDRDQPRGPEGRKTVYMEEESEPIALKRRRNMSSADKGFASSPYTKRVASSADDALAFSRAYSDTKKQAAQKAAKPSTAPNPRVKPQPSTTAKAPAPDVHKHYEETAGERFSRFFRAFLPWKGDPAKEVIRKIIMDVSAIMVLVCFGYFVDNYIQHQNQLKNQELLQQQVTESPTEDLDARWAAVRAKYPDVDFPEGMNIKFAELYAVNQDLVGWLTVDNTNIDTAIVHTVSDRDNGDADDFYLRHNFYKQSDKYGIPYLDAYNTGSVLDKNNVIYGHNMTDGLSFAQLEKYYTIDGFKESPVIKYSTLFNDYYFKIYAVIITNGYPGGDNGYLFNYTVAHFASDSLFESFIEALDERKLYDTGVDINKSDSLITLSTCSYEIKSNDMGRLAVIGRLVRGGESAEVDTSKAIERDNVRYPQIWYDEHKMTNPFADAYRWAPE